MEAAKTPNRLVYETSPYLRQHAYNPVDWFPWCEEAFAKARAENKPVFLSIGYSACHWCHVMEREVFEREEAAAVLNRGFVSIKVDREERPDVDHLYMESCMRMTGGGGWPLTVFMTPEKQPFFAGTYIPLPGFVALADKIESMWNDGGQRLRASAESILAEIAREPTASARTDGERPAHDAARLLKASFDGRFGGFGDAPKFPSAHTLMFLQRYALRCKDEEAGEMARHTLRRMAMGGLRDHVGGGFFRYSTDRFFLIPHFEKMLYDNAMLAIAYAEHGFAPETHELLRFCDRELRAPEGAYYTALDADSEGVEGKYYVFSPQEITDALGESDAKRYCKLYDITRQGNFEGKSLPNLLDTGLPGSDDEAFAAVCHERLLRIRSGRIRPLCDDKILLSSNALMLAALSTCSRLLKTPMYVRQAVTLAEFLLHGMRRDGRLFASYRERLSHHPATSDDYAYLAWGLYRLHQATLDDRWLHSSMEICDDMLRLFADEDGLLWLSGSDVHDLPLRVKNTQDGALPCGNGVAAGVLLRLHIVSQDVKYLEAYRRLAKAMYARAVKYPHALTSFCSALLLEGHGLRVGIPVKREDIKQISEEFHPFASFAPGTGDRAVVCTGGACLPPVDDAAKLREALEGV